MLTFAIALLFVLAAALSLLVIFGMVIGNSAAIRSALRGDGAYGVAAGHPERPRSAIYTAQGSMRRAPTRHVRRAVAINVQRAAA